MTASSTFSDNLVHFVRYLRMSGLAVVPSTTLDLQRAAATLGWDDKAALKAGFRSLTVVRRPDIPVFDDAFELFFGSGSTYRRKSMAELEFAKSELARNEPLVARGTISKAEYDRARLEVDRARARLAEARANVNVKRSQLDMARAALITARSLEQGSDTPGGDERFVIPVRAPIDGRVMRVMQESEAVVAAGTPILEVGDQAQLEIVVDLLSTDAVRVSEGDAVIIEEWGGVEDLAGIVRRVEPFGFTKISALGIEEQRVNVIIDLASPHEQWRSLGHGYRVETRIIIEEHKDVLKIPVSALFRTGDRWSVFAHRDGVARLQLIELGGRNALEAEVRSGLSEGERVVLHPSDQIADGVRVEARP